MNAVGFAGPAMQRRTLFAVVALAMSLGAASNALADPSPVDLKVVDRATGRVMPFWRQNGHLFIAGEPGARYGLRVNNHTGGRVLLVLSVDGVNVLSGDTAKYDQQGYVLDPYESYDVNGWRKSQTEVAAFTFAPQHASYASRTGRPGDVGVIGMAVFNERPPIPSPYAAGYRDRAEDQASRRGSAGAPPPLALPSVMAPPSPAPQARSAPPSAEAFAKSSPAPRADEKLGTGHGAREWSSITLVDFVRATPHPQILRQIEYDTAPHLLARGVTPPNSPDYLEHRPHAFPNEPRESGFVPDPPGL